MRFRWRAGLLGGAVFSLALAIPPAPLPDVIVTHLSSTARSVTVHLQNQGPGIGHGVVRLQVSRLGSGPVRQVEVPSPEAVFGVTRSGPISLEDLGVKPDWNSQIVQVTIEADGQARSSNKTFYEQIERRPGVTHNQSGPYEEKHPDLPDLVIEGVSYDAPHYLKVTYANRGRGRTGADFLISWRSGERTFGGNPYYRFRVPPPGQSRSTGGLTLSRLGLAAGMQATVSVSIDPEQRVRELDPNNNTWTGPVDLR